MFFDEIKVVESSIKQLKTDLTMIKEGVDGHYEELDNVAAHVIAIEAILVEVLKQTEIDSEAVKKWILDATNNSSGEEIGSTKAQAIVDDLLK